MEHALKAIQIYVNYYRIKAMPVFRIFLAMNWLVYLFTFFLEIHMGNTIVTSLLNIPHQSTLFAHVNF